eukprot:10053828-Alexandrium_andersonii.AAC.1
MGRDSWAGPTSLATPQPGGARCALSSLFFREAPMNAALCATPAGCDRRTGDLIHGPFASLAAKP